MGCDNPDPTVQTLAELLLPRWQVLAYSVEKLFLHEYKVRFLGIW